MARNQQQKSDFVSGLGKGFEFVKAISDMVRELGGSDDDLRKVIAQAALRRRIAEVIVGRDGKSFPSLTLAADLIPQGWTVVEDVAPSEFEVKDLEFVTFLKEGESSVKGEVMCQRAKELKANLGFADAKRMLAKQDAIPAEMRGKYIVFAGTVLRHPDGRLGLGVAGLGWHGGRWCLDFGWLVYGWDGRGRLARRK